MKASLLLSLLACSAVFAADNCDCTHFPIQPKSCAPVCAASLLNLAADILAGAVRNSDNGIPPEVASNAACVIVVPGIKNSAFVVGGSAGHGFASCREPRRNGWTAPAAVEIEGGSFGLQIGRSQTDLIILAMNSRFAQTLGRSKFTLGKDASVAAGPVGRTGSAQTDASMASDLLVYSRTRGAFAGTSIQGATLRSDEALNQGVYGSNVNNRQILDGEIKPPDSASKLQDVLNRSFGARAR